MPPMSRLRLAFPMLALAVCAAPAVARAQTCSFSVGPTAVNFGNYDPSSPVPTDSTGTLSFSCKGGNPAVYVALSGGNGALAFNPRQMALGATDTLNYNLYLDAGRTQIWGDGTSYPQDGIDKKNTPYTVYARIFAGQWVAAGVYTDTIIVTLNY